MNAHNIKPKYFFAPSHTFDKNTLKALYEESDIRIISDTIGRFPYKKGDFYFIPQIAGHCCEIPLSGIYTFCLHPNTMQEKAFFDLESFLNKHHKEFISFDDINLIQYGEKKLFDKIISLAFFTYRRLRMLK
ncbi:MAG: DUF2334 domain-containing protein [Prevotella sp.]|nr:DUF2334 domain-containing protein [Prevotella sp.]